MCLCFNWLCLYLAAHSGYWNMQSTKSNVPYRNRAEYELRERVTRGDICPSWIYLSDSHYTVIPPLTITTHIYSYLRKKSYLTHSCKLMLDQTANNYCHHLSINEKFNFLQNWWESEMIFGLKGCNWRCPLLQMLHLYTECVLVTAACVVLWSVAGGSWACRWFRMITARMTKSSLLFLLPLSRVESFTTIKHDTQQEPRDANYF